mmetsp:Transcript_4844/g.7913  ORF Transcript_4844/g.7913 Transcript_4844/m.7913 type:complete len:268 (+) Transcript_4844:149-952(+)
MRLTADVLLRAEHYLNPYMDRELNLRGYKIPTIENLAILQDQFDVIDVSDNDLKRLDGFPPMQRLNTLLIHNNGITRINGTNISTNLPKLSSLMLTDNRISNLSEIEHLGGCKALESLSLLGNAVALKPKYRLYCIHKIPSLKWLDFQKVQQVERDDAKKYFKSAAGKTFITAIAQEAKIISEGGSVAIGSHSGAAAAPVILTDQQKALVKKAIEAATTKEQIDAIEKQLKTGDFAFLNSFIDDTVPVVDDGNDGTEMRKGAEEENN